jgi:hypothetical protein
MTKKNARNGEMDEEMAHGDGDSEAFAHPGIVKHVVDATHEACYKEKALPLVSLISMLIALWAAFLYAPKESMGDVRSSISTSRAGGWRSSLSP